MRIYQISVLRVLHCLYKLYRWFSPTKKQIFVQRIHYKKNQGMVIPKYLSGDNTHITKIIKNTFIQNITFWSVLFLVLVFTDKCIYKAKIVYFKLESLYARGLFLLLLFKDRKSTFTQLFLFEQHQGPSKLI